MRPMAQKGLMMMMINKTTTACPYIPPQAFKPKAFLTTNFEESIFQD